MVGELQAGALALLIALGVWAGHARAQLFSSTGPVIAILDGELLLGEATGHLGGWGTIALRSPSKFRLACSGEFGYDGASGDAGRLKCTDGASPAFRFRRLGLMSGYGSGSAGPGALSFTYGLSAADSAPYLTLPPGKELRGEGIALVAVVPFPR